jgi:catechol 2,3-dioxygenase-like lactoylglutathione lyase family enzyme
MPNTATSIRMNNPSNALVPELSIRNFENSLRFYTQILGFSVAYQRPEEGFAFLTLGTAQIMIDEIGKSRTWATGDLNYPLGRGINLQIEVNSIEPLLANLKSNNIELFLEPEEKWYRVDDYEVGNKQFLVQDPDGYLLRFTEDLGRRCLAT